MDIIQAVRLSGDNADSPDNEYGYGIPDGAFADEMLRKDVGVASIAATQEAERKMTAEMEATEEVVEEETFEFTENPKTLLVKKGNKLKITSPSTLKKITLMYGDQLVSLPNSDIKR